MKNEYVSEPDFWRAAGLSLMDALFFRPYLFVIEFFAFFKYRKLRKGWVSPERTAFKTD